MKQILGEFLFKPFKNDEFQKHSIGETKKSFSMMVLPRCIKIFVRRNEIQNRQVNETYHLILIHKNKSWKIIKFAFETLC